MLKNKCLLLFALYETVQPILMLKLLCKMERLLGKMVFFIFLHCYGKNLSFLMNLLHFISTQKWSKPWSKPLWLVINPLSKSTQLNPENQMQCIVQFPLAWYTIEQFFCFFLCIFKTNWFLTFLTKHWALRDN